MTRQLLALLLFAAITLTPSLSAQEKHPRIEDFAFLTGFWQGTGFGGMSEEMWMPPADGSMFGIFKQSSDAGITFTEFLEITEVGGEFILRMKHFNPDFSGWEEKNDYVTFRLQSVSPNKAVFGGLSYTLLDDNNLQIELRLRQSNDEVTTEVFNLRRRDL